MTNPVLEMKGISKRFPGVVALDGVDLEQISRTVIQPLREMIFRGGKAWRSYGILACMDLVGGDSQPRADWLALGQAAMARRDYKPAVDAFRKALEMEPEFEGLFK